MSSRFTNSVSSPVQGPAKAKKILIVDDEPLVRQFIESSLRAGGYGDLLFGSSGSVVPSIAVSERPDLIIMDVMMPGGNGMRALRMLKQNVHTSGIPVIITSGFNVLTLGDCAQSHAEHFLVKPFSAPELLKEVGRVLGGEGATEHADPPTQPGSPHPGAMAGIPAAPGH